MACRASGSRYALGPYNTVDPNQSKTPGILEVHLPLLQAAKAAISKARHRLHPSLCVK